MKITLAFGVYGTLVDPSGMATHLAHDLGARATEFADCWREKQLEYSFRRGLMHNYADFSICTSDGSELHMSTLQGCHLPGTTVRKTENRQRRFLRGPGCLHGFPPAAPGLGDRGRARRGRRFFPLIRKATICSPTSMASAPFSLRALGAAASGSPDTTNPYVLGASHLAQP
jgi:hypothetical protein